MSAGGPLSLRGGEGGRPIRNRAFASVATPSVRQDGMVPAMREKVALNEAALRLWGLVVRAPSRRSGDGDSHRARVARGWSAEGVEGVMPEGPGEAVWAFAREGTRVGVGSAPSVTATRAREVTGRMVHGLLTRNESVRGSGVGGTASTMRNPAAPQRGHRVTSMPVRRSTVASQGSGSAGRTGAVMVAAGASNSCTLGSSRLRAQLASQP